MASLRCHFLCSAPLNAKGVEFYITKLLHFNHIILFTFVRKIFAVSIFEKVLFNSYLFTIEGNFGSMEVGSPTCRRIVGGQGLLFLLI